MIFINAYTYLPYLLLFVSRQLKEKCKCVVQYGSLTTSTNVKSANSGHSILNCLTLCASVAVIVQMIHVGIIVTETTTNTQRVSKIRGAQVHLPWSGLGSAAGHEQ